MPSRLRDGSHLNLAHFASNPAPKPQSHQPSAAYPLWEARFAAALLHIADTRHQRNVYRDTSPSPTCPGTPSAPPSSLRSPAASLDRIYRSTARTVPGPAVCDNRKRISRAREGGGFYRSAGALPRIGDLQRIDAGCNAFKSGHFDRLFFFSSVNSSAMETPIA